MTKTRLKIITGDKVLVTKGKDKGKTGTVVKTESDTKRVMVQGINLMKKHVKPRGQQKGGIVTVEKPLSLANVMLVCPACGKATRVGYQTNAKDKNRVCKKCNQVIAAPKPETAKAK